MLEKESGFVNSRGQHIFSRSWMPETGLHGLIFLLHGLGEHSGRYSHLATVLTNAGFGVLAFDHHGHGKSAGRRADIQKFDHFVDDARQFIEEQSQALPGLPRVILGHSMGGLIALKCALQFHAYFAAMVVTAPAIKVGGDISPFLQKIAGLVATIAPRLPVEKIDTSFISRDPEIVRQYETDPLIFHGKVCARTGARLLAAGAEVAARLHKIELPFWVGHGTADRLIDPQSAQWLHERARSTDKTLRLYDGLAHEILNEPEKHAILQEIVAWLEKRIV